MDELAQIFPGVFLSFADQFGEGVFLQWVLDERSDLHVRPKSSRSYVVLPRYLYFAFS